MGAKNLSLSDYVHILRVEKTVYFFNWRIIDLHCCVNYCCMAKWFSYIHTYIGIYMFFFNIFHYDCKNSCCYIASVMSNSVQPHRRQPTMLPCPWDSPGNNTGVVAISLSNAWKWKVKGKSLSCVRLLATPSTAAYQAPPSMGFSRQE